MDKQQRFWKKSLRMHGTYSPNQKFAVLRILVVCDIRLTGVNCHTFFCDFYIYCIQYLGRLWDAKVSSEPLARMEQYRISFSCNTMVVNYHFIRKGHLPHSTVVLKEHFENIPLKSCNIAKIFIKLLERFLKYCRNLAISVQNIMNGILLQY